MSSGVMLAVRSRLVLVANDTDPDVPNRSVKQLKGVPQRHLPIHEDDPTCRVVWCGKVLQGATHYSSATPPDCPLCIRNWHARRR